MALTPLQLKSLRYDLVELADINYDDVVDELLDHYASLTEQKMADGLSFDEASKRAWTQLGGDRGVRHIQASSVKTIKRQISTQHMVILKSYFRWPTLLTTVLVAVLVCITVPVITIKWLIGSIVIICLTPFLFLLWGYYYGLHQQTTTGKIVWEYMLNNGGRAASLVQLGLNLPSSFAENDTQATQTFLQSYPTVSILICLVVLLYTASFIQLFHHRYKSLPA